MSFALLPLSISKVLHSHLNRETGQLRSLSRFTSYWVILAHTMFSADTACAPVSEERQTILATSEKHFD